MIAGLVGLCAYDAARRGIVVVSGSDINPFEAIPIFGELLIGQQAPLTARWAAGIVFHLFNGPGFAVFYAVLFGQRGVWAGIGWALILEVAMLAIYPGWLDIRARTEFTIVSAAGHVAYGSAIGVVSKRLLTTSGPR